MATHSSVLAWRIPGTGEPSGLPSMGSHRVRHDWNDLGAAAAEYIVDCGFLKVKDYVFFHLHLNFIEVYPCLENPRGGGAWWADVYGVTQSRTQLKWLSSSSISCIQKRAQILCVQGEEIHKGHIASTQVRKQYLNSRNFSPLFSSHCSPLFSHQGNQCPSFSYCRLSLPVGAIFLYQKKYLI